jgi:GT2 family glycosyltransferase
MDRQNGGSLISIVTLLWRNEEYAGPFLCSLRRSAAKAGINVELIAVQNGPDGAAAAGELNRFLPAAPVCVELTTTDDNLGFAGGMNLGSQRTTGDIIVLANLDLEFGETFVEGLLQLLDGSAPAGLVAPSVTTPTRGPNGATVLEELGALRRSPVHRFRRVKPPDGLAPVPAGNGCCIVMPRPTYERRVAAIGGVFDAEYHSYFEDLDLFWWASYNGEEILFDPGLQVVHHRAGSFGGKHQFAERSPDIQISVMANYRINVWKHARTPGDLVGWFIGEIGYLAWSTTAARLRGVRNYLASWDLALRRARRIRRRRGGLRSPHAEPPRLPLRPTP